MRSYEMELRTPAPEEIAHTEVSGPVWAADALGRTVLAGLILSVDPDTNPEIFKPQYNGNYWPGFMRQDLQVEPLPTDLPEEYPVDQLTRMERAQFN